MSIKSIARELQGYLHSTDLYEETRFTKREKALEAVRILKEAAARNPETLEDGLLAEVMKQAEELEPSILSFNRSVYDKYSAEIRTHRQDKPLLRRTLDLFTTYPPGGEDVHHYLTDDLDILFDGVLNYDLDSLRLPKRISEFHHLERTPARVLLDLIDHLPVCADDVLYDLGSGLGHVVILLNLMLGIKCVGIEIETEYCKLANENIARLGLQDAVILNENILDSTFDDGTIFFFYSPFSGSVLEQVLQNVRKVAEQRTITICTYGPITMEIAKEDWISVKEERMVDPFKLAIFTSK